MKIQNLYYIWRFNIRSMKHKTHILSIAFIIVFVVISFSQPKGYDITNGVGVTAAISKFNITTDNFTTEQGDGFLGGLTATVDIPHRWYNMSFGMQLSENNINISGRPLILSSEEEFIKYKIFAAQIALLGHIKLIQNYVTIDVGPMLQYNGKLELKDKSKEGYYINNYDNLSAKDITNISQFNLNGAIGASAGVKYFRIKAQYIYGFTNILKKLESQDIDTTGGDSRFKGNQSMLVLGAMLTF